MNDLRLAVRMLRRNPVFTAAAVVTLALGIGANTAIFSVVHGVLLRPLPYSEPDRLMAVWESNPAQHGDRNNVTDGSYVDWRVRNRVFEELGAYGQPFGAAVIGPDAPVEVTANRLSPSIFRVLGADAQLGRVFLPEDGVPGGEPVALLSHRLWRDLFGADPGVVGRTIQFEESPFTVVGVMPSTFEFPSPEHGVWIPLRINASGSLNRTAHRWRVVGRLAPGVTLERARDDMDGIAQQLREEHPAAMEGWGVHVVGYHDDLVGTARPLLLALYGFVGILLLIACANVASMLLAHEIRREREFTVRGALGATRARLMGQLVLEVGVLSVLGVAGGIILAAWGIGILVGMAPADIPRLSEIRLDGTVFAYATAAGLASAVVFGLVPAWRAGRADPGGALRSARSAGSIRHSRHRAAVLVGQLALSSMLLVGAGLLTRSFLTLQAVEHGFEPDRLLAAAISLPYGRYGNVGEQDAFFGRVTETLAALPGVESVAGTAEPPITGPDNTFGFRVAGQPPPSGDGERPVQVRLVTPGYFATVGIPLIDGRGFTNFDRAGQPDVAVVNRSFARQFWPDGRAIGQRIGFEGEEGAWIEVVGVVGDTRHAGLDQPVEPAVYVAHAQKAGRPWEWMNWMTFMVRTYGDPLGVAADVRRVIQELDERLPIRRLAPVTDLYASSHAQRTFAAALIVAFAGVAFGLALFGIFGLVSYSVQQRTREVGVRLALGARRADIIGNVLWEGLVMASLGTLLGVAGALLVTRFIQGLLFGITAADPLTYAATVGLLTGAALLACWVPARRAARIDPMQVLRHE